MVIRDNSPILMGSKDSKTLFPRLMVKRFPDSLIFQKKIDTKRTKICPSRVALHLFGQIHMKSSYSRF